MVIISRLRIQTYDQNLLCRIKLVPFTKEATELYYIKNVKIAVDFFLSWIINIRINGLMVYVGIIIIQLNLEEEISINVLKCHWKNKAFKYVILLEYFNYYFSDINF